MLECNLPLIHRKDFFNEDLRKYFIQSNIIQLCNPLTNTILKTLLIHFKKKCIFITKINEIFVLQEQNEPASLNQAVIYVNMLIYIVPF